MSTVMAENNKWLATAALKQNSFYWYFSPSGYTVGYLH